MFRSRLLLVLSLGLGAAFVVSACSDDDSSESEQFISDYCSLLMPCCKQAGLSGDPSDCKMILTAFTAGAGFNEAKGDQCIAAMRAASANPDFCSMDDDVLEDNGACDDVFDDGGSSGSVQPGGECESSSDCADTAEGEGYCYHDYRDGVSYETCMVVADGVEGSAPCIGTRDGNMTSYSGGDGPPPTMGYICDEADGLYCNYESGVCEAKKAIGESCSSYTVRCVDGAYCEGGVCTAQHPAGGECSSSYSDECVETAYCDDDANQCKEKLPDGAACTSYEQCLSNSCSNDKCEPQTDFGIALFCGD